MLQKAFQTYYGGKNSNGTYQAIINEIPPHQTLIVPFLGNCAVTRLITQAAHTYLNDIDLEVYHRWQQLQLPESYSLYHLDYKQFLRYLRDKLIYDSGTFIFCDPPYLKSTRRSTKDVYNYEFSRKNHEELLSLLLTMTAKVMISAIPNSLYDQSLKTWRKVYYKNKTRHGVVTECIYMNYDLHLGELHDYNFLGIDFTDRQRIKRKIKRLFSRLDGLPEKELAYIKKIFTEKYLKT
jgi:site-specific DNA-adenine methylase